MKSILPLLLISIMTFGVIACDKKNEEKKEQTTTITVTKQPRSINLSYGGNIDPIRKVAVTSAVEGTVESLHFKYGQLVKKDQLLFTVDSPSLQEDYRSALTDFLKAKDSYLNTVASFQGTEELKKYGLVDEQSYRSEKSTLENSSLALMTSRSKLVETTKKIPDLSIDELEKLSLDDIGAVTKVLNRQYERIDVRSPMSGIALFPTTSAGSDGDKEIEVGSSIKKAQALVTIGDLSGLSIDVKVGQADINRLKQGMPVTVTSPALPETNLNGKIVAVGAQAEQGGGGQSEFPVVINVTSITEKQQQLIRVGMSADVNVSIALPEALMIPIKAVYVKNGKTVVDKVAKEGAKPSAVEVVTGRTTENEVTILNGLQSGDKILVHH